MLTAMRLRVILLAAAFLPMFGSHVAVVLAERVLAEPC